MKRKDIYKYETSKEEIYFKITLIYNMGFIFIIGD